MSEQLPREVAIAAAQVGGRILRRAFGQVQRVTHKGLVDLVTEQDRRSEAAIAEVIRAAFPDHAILAEEGGTSAGSPAHRWIVDPLDGTTNYAHGYPVFAVSVAYEENGELEVGVILDPLRRELFVAERGRGATLNGRPIAVSSTSTLIASLLETGFPYDRARLALALDQLNRLAPRSQGMRRSGSAALSLAYVAAGRLDGFWEATLSPWDMAAGALLVRAAGGTVSLLNGAPFTTTSTEILATNGQIHGALIQELG
jgi:myo-inositol-1(or 4)-monophosphatase